MKRPPLIAHIIYSLATGGLENGLINIINRMPAGQFRHAIICITTAEDFAERISASDVEIVQLHKQPGHDWQFYRALRRELKRLQPAIVHSRNLAALEAQLCTLGMGSLKRVHGEHGREIGDLQGRNWKYLWLRRCMRPLIDQYIAMSCDLQRWLMEDVWVPAEKVNQIYNGVDRSRFRPRTVKPLAALPEPWARLDDTLVIGTVGRLTPVKDQQLLLRTAQAIREQNRQLFERLRFVFVGDGPQMDELVTLSQQLDLGGSVWFAGDRTDVPELLASFDIFVLPSLGEGVSNTVLEAMATGLPVIATKVGGNVELVEKETGMLFPVGDCAALTQCLLALLQDDSMRQQMGERARQKAASQFDWDVSVAQYQRIYSDLLGISAQSEAGVVN